MLCSAHLYSHSLNILSFPCLLMTVKLSGGCCHLNLFVAVCLLTVDPAIWGEFPDLARLCGADVEIFIEHSWQSSLSSIGIHKLSLVCLQDWLIKIHPESE